MTRTRIGDGPHWESHRRDAQAEDVAWLQENAGLTHAEACARVGTTPATLGRRDRRRADREHRGG